MTINFQEKTVVIKEQETITCSSVEVKQYIDNTESVVALIHLGGSEYKRLTLWEGAAYEAIGQWTDTDAQARILELI